MPRANEFTPLLVSDDNNVHPFRVRRRRSVWQLVLAGALSLAVLSLFQEKESDSVPVEIADTTVSFDEDTSDAEFLSSMETFKNPSVDPCVDFYQYACGGWLQQHDIPLDRPAIDSSFYVVSESNKDTIQRIFSQNPPQIGPLYQSCISGQEVDADAVAFVAQLIDSVHQANSTLALMEVAGRVDQSLGISTFFSWGVGADPQNPSTNVLQFAQGGLTLPSREYYLQEDKVDAYAALFVDYVTKLFAVGDLDRHNVSEYAEAVLETETKLAEISLPNAALRDPWTTSTAYPFAEIAHKYPFLMAYLHGIYKQEPFPMLEAIIATPAFFDAQNELLRDDALLPQLKNYLSFHLMDSFGALLGEYFRRASHAFHGKIQGAGALLPRDQFCVRLTTTFLGNELGEYYMKDVFGPDAKAAAQALVAEIEESLRALLLTESWLDKVTYEAAVAKLDKVKNFIGGPDEVEPLPFELRADAFFNNVKSLMQLSAAAAIEAIDKPVDKQAWDMFPSTVNAYYDPSANKMVFPAAILQQPFYSAEHFPAAANFARIGMVMGHELSHGFDDQGRNFDGDGALRSWWTPSVSAEFAEKAHCLAAQYSTFPVASIDDGHVLGTVNGNLTLGENIADNGGIHLAYEAYQLWKSAVGPPPIEPPTEVPAEAPEPVEMATPAPVAPIADTPVPVPTDIDPGEQIPAVTLPAPALPVPDAENPEPVQTEPSGEIPVPTPSPPEAAPEPERTESGPGQVVPEETAPATQTPAPTETEPVPAVTLPPPPTAPTPPAVPTPPGRQTPEPSDAVPSETKHTHEKEKDEPEEEEPAGKRKRHEGGESEKSKSKGEDDERHGGHKHSADQHGEEKSKHGAKDEEDKASKRERSRKSDDNGEERHHRQGESEGDEGESKRHKKPDEEHDGKREADRHGGKERRHEDEESEGKRRHGKREEEDDDRHHRREHERREERHRHDEAEGEEKEGHGHKHDDRDEESDRHGKHGHRREEEERHGRHEDKEARREKRKERGKEDDEKHRRDEKKDRWEEEHDSERHEKHRRRDHEDREDRWDECGGCEREEHRRHNRHKHDEDWDEESGRRGCGEQEGGGCGSKRHRYPFSGGDAQTHRMVERLARAIAQPGDPIADDRLFFTAFAQNWCEKRSPAYAELLRTIDPHSPGQWRVNGPLMNYHKFAEAFSCPLGTPMNPEEKCVIW